MKTRKLQVVFVLMILVLIVGLVFAIPAKNYSNPYVSVIIIYVLGISMIGYAMLVYRITKQVMLDAKTDAEGMLIKEQQKLKESQFQVLESRHEETERFHDSTWQEFNRIYELLHNQKYDEADNCLLELTEYFEKERYQPICNDNLLNALLDNKRYQASKKSIQVEYEILLQEEYGVSPVDMCSILFNLLDNGIESCQNAHVSNPYIHLQMKQVYDKILIHMENSKDSNTEFRYKTSKVDSYAHGFGLPIIESIVGKYDGSCEWNDEGDKFVSLLMIPLKNSQEEVLS